MIRPRDFASDTPPPRIIGSECEYDVQFASKKDQAIHLANFMNAANAVDAGLTSATNNGDGPTLTKYFMFNGGKFYDDMSKFAEYATPESLGPKEAMLTDFAGIFAEQPETV